MLLATLTDPADPVTGQLIHTVGRAETLDLATTPGLSVPSPVDPVAGAFWRQQAQGRYSEALPDMLAALTSSTGSGFSHRAVSAGQKASVISATRSRSRSGRKATPSC